MSTLKRHNGTTWESVVPSIRNSGPAATLAYAETLTPQTGITTVIDLVGLSVTVTVPEGRRIKISGQIFLRQIGLAGSVDFYIREGATNLARDWHDEAASAFNFRRASCVITPTAGTHTYKLAVGTNAGSTDTQSGVGSPGFIHVEDVTGSTLPYNPASVPVGVLAIATKTTQQGSLTTGVWTPIVGLTANVVVPAGRTIRAVVHSHMQNSAIGGTGLRILDNGVQIAEAYEYATQAGSGFEVVATGVHSPSAGVHNYTVEAWPLQGGTGTQTATVGMPAQLIIEDISPTPTPSTGAPGSTLSYAEVTTFQAGLSAETDLVGLTTTVTVPAGRRLKITAHGQINNDATLGVVIGRIKEGTTELGRWVSEEMNASKTTLGDGSVIVSPSAGTHTYKLSLTKASGSGTIDLAANATIPAFILVEDITGSVWPEGLPYYTGTSTLGYSQVVADQTVGADFNPVTVTVPAGRRIKISAKAFAWNNQVDETIALDIKEGATTLQISQTVIPIAGANGNTSLYAEVILSPTAGTHTYTMLVRRATGTGTVTVSAGATIPAFLLVEDITGNPSPNNPSTVPVGVLAQATSTTSVLGVTATGTLLTTNIVVPAGRIIKITAGCDIKIGVTNGRALGEITIDGVSVGRWFDRGIATTGSYTSATDSILVSPTAGSHVVAMTYNALGNSTDFEASAANPMHLFVEDVTPTPAPAANAPSSTLGYAEVSTLSQAIGLVTTDLTGLSVTVTVPAGRRLKIKGFCYVKTDTVDARSSLYLVRGAAPQIQGGFVHHPSTNVNTTIEVEGIDTPAAGTHTYKLTGLASAGTSTYGALASGHPAYLLIEDITPVSVLPTAIVPGAIVATSTTRPSSPATGTVIYETDTGRLLVFSGTVWWDVMEQTMAFNSPGALTVSTGTSRFRFPWAVTVLGVTAAVNTAPTGASVIVDINKVLSGAAGNGTTIYTTQANRPTIAATAYATTTETTPDVTAFAAGDVLKADIDQIGSTIAGSDLTIVVRYRRT